MSQLEKKTGAVQVTEAGAEEEETGVSEMVESSEAEESKPTLSDLMSELQAHKRQQEAQQARQEEITAQQEQNFKALQHQFQLLQSEVQSWTSRVPELPISESPESEELPVTSSSPQDQAESIQSFPGRKNKKSQLHSDVKKAKKNKTGEEEELMFEEANKKGKRSWLARVEREFQNGPFASNIVFGFLLVALEELVETEFVCPCRGLAINILFVLTFFIFPGISSAFLTASVTGKRLCHCCVPIGVWVILLLFDGRYISCAAAGESGRYVTADRAPPLKWCEPENGTLYLQELKQSQLSYFVSQWFGLFLSLFLVVGCCMWKGK